MWLILSSWDCGWQCHDVNCNWLCSWWNITEHVVAWTIANKSKKKINHPTVNMVLSVMPPCMLRNVKNSRSKQRKTRQDNPFTVETTTYFLLLSQQLQLNNTRTKLPRCIGDSCNQEQTTMYWQLVIWWSLMVMWGKVVVWFDVVVGITKSCDICETKLLFRFFTKPVTRMQGCNVRFGSQRVKRSVVTDSWYMICVKILQRHNDAVRENSSQQPRAYVGTLKRSVKEDWIWWETILFCKCKFYYYWRRKKHNYEVEEKHSRDKVPRHR